MPMKVGIYTNLYRDNDCKVTKSVSELLKAHSIEVVYHENLKGLFDGEFFNLQGKNKPDILVSIGGDGTILGLVEFCQTNLVPIIGINKGTMGFLTEIAPNAINELVDLIIGEHMVERRKLIKVTLGDKSFFALNEIVVYRNNNAKMITLDLKIRDQLVDRYACDGFIVCTPTGSTAYSLSAGGPVVGPGAEVHILTPINSHSLHSRPIVVNNNEIIKISLKKFSMESAIIADGNNVMTAKVGDVIEITRADKYVDFIRKPGYNFYSNLLEKLNILGTTDSD